MSLPSFTSGAKTAPSVPAGAIADCLAALGRRIDGEVRSDRYSRVLYSTDASIYQVMPVGVVIPRSRDEVHATVETAAEYGVPLLPRTAGTSLAGQAVNEALVVDMSRHLDAVLDFDPAARTVRVEPGIVLDALNDRLATAGLAFGPDPASSDRACIGGIVSNNSTGAHSILYGMTADHVLEMGVVLADGSRARLGPLEAGAVGARERRGGLEGSIYRRLASLTGNASHRATILAATPRHWRRCGGYNLDRLIGEGARFRHPLDTRFNLAKLVCGGEGGLAVMTDVTLGLVEAPRRKGLVLLHFDSLREALTAVPAVLAAGPAAVELLDQMGLTLCRGVREYGRLLDGFIEGDPDCVLICEFHGASRAEVEAGVDRLVRRAGRDGIGAEAAVPVIDRARQRDVWTVRKVALGLLMSIRGDYKPLPFIEDAAVPVEHLAEYVAEIERFCGDLGTRVAYYAHASAGCLHIRPLIDTKQAAEIAKMPEILSFSVELLHGYGGALSSEHGDGRTRSWINERFFGPELYGLYRQVKHAFDPRGLLNPGTVVDAPPMTEALRYGDGYRTSTEAAHLDFSDEQGLARAVEMCNGAGVCRRRAAGTMCPSFIATREEEHSTRGRANALRAAMSGLLPPEELTSRRMYEVMDLCVECKACKTECPSSVDMAKIKTEFLAAYRAANGVPLRDRLFADIATVSRWASGWRAPWVNATLGSPGVRLLLEKTLGIDRRRTLPRWARRSFVDWHRRQAPQPVAARGEVALFHDTFNTFSTPRVARAATELLAAAGFRTVLPGHRCCGRPLLSKGLVDEARIVARDTLDRLSPLAERGLPIVGLEPSCLSALRDDYLYLLPNDRRVRPVAAATVSLEELLDREIAAGRLRLDLAPGPTRAVVHGHCHDKALGGTGATERTLRLVPGLEVADSGAGCCGMAGAFGYESEHYRISLAMAAERLVPAVEAADEASWIVAAGFSCRQQIEQATRRRALHPAEVLRRCLSDSAAVADAVRQE